MRTKNNWNKSIFFYLTLLILLLLIPSYFFISQVNQSILLLVILVFFVVLTLWRGTVMGLISNLLFIFISGSTLLYIRITGANATFDTNFTMQNFFSYGVVLLLLILCAGKINELLTEQEVYLKNLQQDVQKLVAIDVETGFENESRMRLTVNEEMRRADRQKHSFVFIVLKLENYDEFKKLYGVNEAQHLWKQLADKMRQTVRLTDKKFRFHENQLALLLIDTSDQYIENIYDKLDKTLKNHQLLNERLVTLKYKTSYFTYQPGMDQSFEELLAEMERELKTSEL